MPLEPTDLFMLQRGDSLYKVTLEDLKISIQEALEAKITELVRAQRTLEQEIAVLKAQN